MLKEPRDASTSKSELLTKPDIIVGVGDNVRLLLQCKNWRPADLARQIKVTPQAISQWLLGRTEPSHENLVKIASLAGVSVDALRQPLAIAGTTWSPPEIQKGPVSSDARRLRLRPYSVGQTGSDPANEEWIAPASALRGLASEDPDLVVLRVVGTALEPELRAGEFLVADLGWKAISMTGIYLLGDARSPILRHCEPVIGSDDQAIWVRDSESRREVPAEAITVLGRAICKLAVPI